ncbi:hypothetical protein [Reyranella sp.]|uniref:hypothetical protein n=1 Tax=Reyranella sp. TaxID=1929291 RepID=UPI003784737D
MNIERYSEAHQIELGRSLLGRRKIYLDACFWIVLRDVELGRRTGTVERKLLHFLRRGVFAGKLICPISVSMFSELMKQPYTSTRRRATAQLIDELSLGVSMVDSRLLLSTEIKLFLQNMKAEDALHTMQELIWTKVAHILGVQYSLIPSAVLGGEPPKDMFDYVWQHSLVALVDAVGDAKMPHNDYSRLSNETNAQNRQYRDELKSFKITYDIELRGLIELVGAIAADVLVHFASREVGEIPVPIPQQRAESVNACKNILYYSMKKAEYRSALRTLHVQASLYAAMRWDKERKFKPNDFYDFEHATAALTYCDAFLTESPLHILVTRPQIDLEQVNGCRVISDLDLAVEFVRTVAREPF